MKTLTFNNFWTQLNAELKARGAAEAQWGDAHYHWNNGDSVERAANLIQRELDGLREAFKQN